MKAVIVLLTLVIAQSSFAVCSHMQGGRLGDNTVVKSTSSTGTAGTSANGHK